MTVWTLRRATETSQESALLARARAGDRAALQALLTPRETLVLRVCLSQLGNAADAEDAAQETLLQAIRALTRAGGFRGDAALTTWMVRIALNVCATRRRRARPTAELSPDSGQVDGPEESVVNRLALEAALARLTSEQRAALLLQALEGWSVREIAAALRVSEKRVENDLYRARKALARETE